jgi:hypothetical protein
MTILLFVGYLIYFFMIFYGWQLALNELIIFHYKRIFTFDTFMAIVWVFVLFYYIFI